MGCVEKTRLAISTGASTVARPWRSGETRPLTLAVRYRDRDPLNATPGSVEGSLAAERLRPNVAVVVPRSDPPSDARSIGDTGGEADHPEPMRPMGVAVRTAGWCGSNSAVVQTGPVPLVRMKTVSDRLGSARGEGTQWVGEAGASMWSDMRRQL